jgi:tetratricopeptide (TPR) repeat protein
LADDFEALTEMVFVRRAFQYLPLAERVGPAGSGAAAGPTEPGRKFTAWLLEHREIARPFFRSLGDVKDRPAAMAKLHELFLAEESLVLGFPDLAIAFATAVPAKHLRDQPNAATLVESFKWYAAPSFKPRYDMKKMPYELLRYIADTRVSLAERKWAVARYARSPTPQMAYFDIQYDTEHLFRGTPKKNDAKDYSLPNLAGLGGVCFDQAYYASEVCKALGIPAVVVFGRGGSGVPHSWFAHFSYNQGKPQWDARCGRYQGHLFLSGLVRDPALEDKIPDSVLSLLGVSMYVPLAARENADAAVALARLVEQSVKEKRTVDPAAVLKPWVDDYVARSSPDEKTLKTNTGWIQPRRAIEPVLMEDLIGGAIGYNLAHAPAWDYIVELRTADALPIPRTGRFLDLLISKTAKAYPDYSFTQLMRIIPTLAEFSVREGVYAKMMDIYSARADLQGRTLLALGDDLRDQKADDRALKVYEQAAQKCAALAEIVTKAAAKVEEIHMENNQRDAAINYYRRLFNNAKKDKDAGIFRNQTVHYQLGSRLAALLTAAGRASEAKTILRQIE